VGINIGKKVKIVCKRNYFMSMIIIALIEIVCNLQIILRFTYFDKVLISLIREDYLFKITILVSYKDHAGEIVD
jgi:hypothetical protein